MAERAAQDVKWGVQDHAPRDWLPILVEEVGEAANALVEWRALAGGIIRDGIRRPENIAADNALDDYRAELIQVAAVAVAAVECFDRQMAAHREAMERAAELRASRPPAE
jgi:NTP pyrophosphatase (non-canonical NTP hydrolase)